jgi:hypothetical protein
LQGLQAAAEQGLQGLQAAAAQGLQGLQAEAAQGLQGLQAAAAQGLQGLQVASCSALGLGCAWGSCLGAGASAALAAGAEESAITKVTPPAATPPAAKPAITAKGTIVEESKVDFRVSIASSELDGDARRLRPPRFHEEKGCHHRRAR